MDRFEWEKKGYSNFVMCFFHVSLYILDSVPHMILSLAWFGFGFGSLLRSKVPLWCRE